MPIPGLSWILMILRDWRSCFRVMETVRVPVALRQAGRLRYFAVAGRVPELSGGKILARAKGSEYLFFCSFPG